MLLEGLHIPLTTPFHSDGRLNPRKLAANVLRYSKTPASGLIILGPSGEPSLLSDDETREILRTAAESAAPEKVLTAGIYRDSVHSVLALADYAASLDYDAILVGAPTVLARSTLAGEKAASRTLELLTYFRTIADRSGLPVIIDGEDGRVLTASSIIELAAHPNIYGLLTSEPPTSIKEIVTRTASIHRDVTVTQTFSAVTTRMKKAIPPQAGHLISASALLANTAVAVAEPPAVPTLRTRTKSVSFQILSCNAQAILDGLEGGTVGAAPAFAACAPQACFEVFAAWKDGDMSLAKEKQERLREAASMTENFLGAGGFKFAADLNVYFGGHPRLPHLPPNGEQRSALEHMMKKIGN